MKPAAARSAASREPPAACASRRPDGRCGTDLSDPATNTKLVDQFLFPIPGTSADIQKRAEADARIWGGLIRDLKIQMD